MKKIIILLTSLVMYLSSFSQEYKEIGILNDLKLVELNGKLGLISYNGKYAITPDDYTEITFDEKNWVYRCYKTKNTFEIVGESFKKVQSDLLFTDIIGSDNDSEGSFKVKSENGIGLIRIRDWKELIPAVYDKITEEIETYHGGYVNYILEKDGKKGLFLDNKLILKAEYDEFHRVDIDNYANMLIVSKNKMKGLINLGAYDLGKETILPIEYQEIELVLDNGEEQIYKVKKENLWGVYSSRIGKNVVPITFQKMDWKNRKNMDYGCIIEVKQNNKNKYVITDLKNDSLLVVSEEIVYFDNDEVVAIKNKEENFQFVRVSYELKLYETSYQEIKEFEGYYAVKFNDMWGMLDDLVSPMIEIKFSSFEELKLNYQEGY